jgi:zinc protease
VSPRRALALLVAAAAAVAPLAAPAPARAAAAPAAPAYTVAKPVERQLKNQMKVYIIEDHRLPLVHYRFMVRAGAANEPAEKARLANLTMQTLRQGTADMDARAISEALDGLGAEWGGTSTRDYSAVTAQFLSRDWRTGLDLVAKIVQQPTFPRDEVERQRNQVLGSIQQSRDQNSAVATEHAAALVYGEHPYARPTVGDAGSVQGITRDDIVRFHQTYFRANLCLLVVVGDVDPEQVMADIEAQFRDLEKGEAPSRPGPALPALTANRIRLLDKPGVTQTELRIGFEGTNRRTPDFYSLQVMNYILGGGGFSSRLLENARSKGGLTYSASTSFDFGMDKGAFYASTFTKNASVGAMLDVVLGTIRDFRAQGATAKEVEDAKRFLVGALPFGVQTAEGLAAQWAAIDFYDLGTDYFDRYGDRVRAVTPADVKAAADKYLRSENVAIVAVSTADSVQAQLERFGEVEVLDFRSPTGAIPQSKPTEAVAPGVLSAESVARAKAVVDRAVQAHGGAAKLRGVKDVASRSTMSITTPNGTIDGQIAVSVRMPDKSRIEMTMLGQSGVQVLNGDKAWASNGGQIQDLNAEQTQAMKSGIRTQVLPLLSRLAAGEVQVGWVGEDRVGTEAVDVVQVVDPDAMAKLSFAKGSGLLLRLEQEEPAMFGGGKVPMARLYTDYRPVDGLMVPHRTERQVRGQRLIEDVIQSLSVNKGVAESQFQRPPR